MRCAERWQEARWDRPKTTADRDMYTGSPLLGASLLRQQLRNDAVLIHWVGAAPLQSALMLESTLIHMVGRLSRKLPAPEFLWS